MNQIIEQSEMTSVLDSKLNKQNVGKFKILVLILLSVFRNAA